MTCLASSITSNQSNSNTYTLDDVGELVNTFMAYRDPPGCIEFATAMGDPERQILADEVRCRNYLPLYLFEDSTLFDTVRKMYHVCNMKGFELQKSRLREALKSEALFLDILALCLPYTPGYQESEKELVAILKEICYNANYIDDDGRLRGGRLFISDFLDQDRFRSWRPFQNKKYRWGMIRYALLSATSDERDHLVKFIESKLSLQNLIELNEFARKHGLRECFFDIDALVYGKKKENSDTIASGNPSANTKAFESSSANTSTNQLASEQSSLGEVFLYDGIREEILEYLDWVTLWYSMPYVNKILGSTVSRKFVIQKCRDLKEYLKVQAKIYKPKFLFNMIKPWNSLFPSFHHLVKFYVDNLYDDDIPDPWRRKILEGISLFEYDDEIVAKSLKGRRRVLFLKLDQSMDSLVKVANIFLKSPGEYNAGIFEDIQGPLLVQLIGKVDQPMKLFQFLCNRIIRRLPSPYTNYINAFMVPILLADKLDWPEEVKEQAEIEIHNYCGVPVKLPFTAEQIQKLEPEQLHTIVTTFQICSLALENKVFEALSESDSNTFSAFIADDFLNVLRTIFSLPLSMNEQQFERFLRIAIKVMGHQELFQSKLSELVEELFDYTALALV